MAGDQEHQPAAAAEHTVDQDKCGGGDDMAAAVAPKRKVRMHPADVRFVMSLKREELGGPEFLDEFAHLFTPEEMEEKRRLHEELAAIYRKDNDEIEARQAQMARELSEKGYVEVDEKVDPADHKLDPAALEEERKKWGPNLEDYEGWANEAEYDRWAIAYWESTRDKRTSKFAGARASHDEEGPGWTVRPFDAQDEEEQYGDEDEDSDEYDELEVEDEDEDKDGDDNDEEEEDEDKDGGEEEEEEEETNTKSDSDGKIATLECN